MSKHAQKATKTGNKGATKKSERSALPGKTSKCSRAPTVNSDGDDSSQDEEHEQPRKPHKKAWPAQAEESKGEVIEDVDMEDEPEEITIDLTRNDEVSWFNFKEWS